MFVHLEHSMTRLDVTAARRKFSEVTSKVEYANESFIIQRHGKDAAAIIPVRQLELLERVKRLMENRSDARAVRAALAESNERMPLDDFLRELEKE
jgi:mRNA interferase RelE/StbE